MQSLRDVIAEELVCANLHLGRLDEGAATDAVAWLTRDARISGVVAEVALDAILSHLREHDALLDGEGRRVRLQRGHRFWGDPEAPEPAGHEIIYRLIPLDEGAPE